MKLPLENFGAIVDAESGLRRTSEWLASQVGHRSQMLRSHGVGKGDKVLIRHGGTAEFFADLFSCWEVGACVACLNPGLTDAELRNIVNFIKPKLLIQREHQEFANGVDIAVLSCEGGSSNETCIVAAQPDCGCLDDEALILFTSGTTGTPKGVVHTFRSLVARIALNQAFMDDGALVSTLCPLPTHFGHGLIGNCLTALFAGSELILMKPGDMRATTELGKTIDTYDVTFISSVPAMWKIVTKVALSPKKSSLIRVHVGSAPLSGSLWKDIINWCGIDNVVNMYGITEAANWIAGASARDDEIQDGLIGKMWGGSAAVLTEDGDICSCGKGELLIQTPSVMKGYYKLPEQTTEAVSSGWLYTGDAGRIEPDGTMRLTGRRKFEINRAGIKVHPEDIDMLLETHPAVREACAFGIEDDLAGQIVGVAVSFVPSEQIHIDALRQWCTERLVREKVPERWFALEEIPKTDRGKVNRDIVAAACLVAE